MTKFFDLFAKQSLPVKLAILAAALLIIAGVEYQVFYSTKKDELDRLVQITASLKQQYVENKAVADNLPKFQEEVNALNEQLKQAVALLPNEAEVHTLFRQLSVVAKKTNVDLLSFHPAGQSNRGFYSDLSMDLKLEGTYNDIAVFIDQVGKLSRIINISNLSFSNIKLVGNSMMLTLDCKATTFMFSGARS